MSAPRCGRTLGCSEGPVGSTAIVLQQLAPTSSDPREDLDRWRASRPTNFYDATPNLAASLRAHLGESGLAAIEPGLRSFGQAVATVVDPAVDVLDPPRRPSPPPMRSGASPSEWSSTPNTRAPVAPSGARASCRRRHLSRRPCSTCSPMRARAGTPARSSAPPASCVRCSATAHRSSDSGSCRRCSTPTTNGASGARNTYTELQGGSDVGANLVEATPDGELWRIGGEKWFCSVADAEQFLITARVQGGHGGGRAALAVSSCPERFPAAP